MKRRLLAFVVFFALAGCFAGNSPIGPGAGLSPSGSPLGAGGMAGPAAGASSSAFVPSGAEADGNGGASGGTDTGAGGDKGRGAADPTAGDDTPMTMTGTPVGMSRKPDPCPSDFRLCFSNLAITATPGDGTGRLHYEVDGTLATQETGSEALDPAHAFVYLIDLLFPENQQTTATAKLSGNFVATVDSSPGRGLRFQAGFCKHTTTLDTILPEPSASPLVLNPCGGTDPTDVVIQPSRTPPPFDRDIEFESILMSN